MNPCWLLRDKRLSFSFNTPLNLNYSIVYLLFTNFDVFPSTVMVVYCLSQVDFVIRIFHYDFIICFSLVCANFLFVILLDEDTEKSRYDRTEQKKAELQYSVAQLGLLAVFLLS